MRRLSRASVESHSTGSRRADKASTRVTQAVGVAELPTHVEPTNRLAELSMQVDEPPSSM
jgi:hypothetical protein